MKTQAVIELIDNLEKQISKLNQIVISRFNKVLSEHVEKFEEIKINLLSLESLEVKHLNKKAGIEHIYEYHQKSLDILSSIYKKLSSDSIINSINTDLKYEIESYINELPDVVILEYDDSYSEPLNEQSKLINILWKVEKFNFRIKKNINTLRNQSRKIFKKESEPIPKRVHTLNIRKLVETYVFPKYFTVIEDYIQQNRTQIIGHFKQLYDWEYDIISNTYVINKDNPIKTASCNILISNESLFTFFEKNKIEINRQIRQSGTLRSLPFLLENSRNRIFNNSFEGLEKADKFWQSSFFALFEDWRFRENLYSYTAYVKSANLNIETIYNKRVKSSLLPEVEKQIAYTNTILKNLPDPDTTDMETLRTFLFSELYKLKKGDNTHTKNSKTYEAVQDISKLLQKLEIEIIDKLSDFEDKTGVVKDADYSIGVKSSEIKYFSPKEFIEFECLPSLRDKNALVKAELGDSIESVLNKLTEFDQIIDFYLDSAIALTEKQGVTEAQIIDTFKDGLERLLNINNKISTLLKDILKNKLIEVSVNTNKYIERVEKLYDNDNILSIYSQLIKSKAIVESKNRQLKISAFFQSTFENSYKYANTHLFWLKNSYTDIRNRLKSEPASSIISSEISNYLSEIQNRIYKLPIIYQHLFENAPVKEVNLFLSRENELEKLNKAYKDWVVGNYAATLLIGENGGGKSSILHYYANNLKSSYHIRDFSTNSFYYTEEDYFKLINELFNQEGLCTDEEVNDYIDSLKERRIVIIDGLERLFLRKVNGFICLQKLLSLIVYSNHKIFWLCSISMYASIYLNKTIVLSEHFDYTINIDNLNSTQIKNIILKRNRISGYQVKYQIDEEAENNNKEKKLSQKQLEDNFFFELNKFAYSNISLSINYWLQSIISVNEDSYDIYIDHFKTPDFGFIKSLSPEKSYTLLLVLMHGKLSIKLHALIYNQKLDKSAKILNILKEDSILIKQGEYFKLNGILYRHLVKHFEDKNLIH